jgi:hypothetical protein
MSPLRKQMEADMVVRGLAYRTREAYVESVAKLAKFYGKGSGDPARAAECFIDFWMGPGAWDHTPEPRKGPIATSVTNIRGWANALFGEPTPLRAFAELDVPVSIHGRQGLTSIVPRCGKGTNAGTPTGGSYRVRGPRAHGTRYAPRNRQ